MKAEEKIKSEEIRIDIPPLPPAQQYMAVGQELRDRADDLGFDLGQLRSGHGKDYDRTAHAKLLGQEHGVLVHSVYRELGRGEG